MAPVDLKVARRAPAPADPLTLDEVNRLIAEAEAGAAAIADLGGLKRDPYRLAIEVLISVTRALGAVTSAVVAARNPLTPAERAEIKAEMVRAVAVGAEAGASREARYLGRKIDRRLAVWIGLAVGLAFVGGGATVAVLSAATDTGRFGATASADLAWQALIRDNPDPRPAIKASGIQTDVSGRRFYMGLSMWAEPAPAPRR